uniref:Uncharacterized protein n=1 Tax=Streptomyces avermitilis TaxID=33903 RepID=A0A499V510_STRAX|nr:hypothetical protein SAVMC3_19930 [Streptomyces avermitilis]
MTVPAVLAQQGGRVPERQVRRVGHRQVGVRGVQGRAFLEHASVARSASSAASATSSAASSSAPSSRRSVASTARARAASTTSGEAVPHTPGTCAATSSWRKLWNVAVTTPAPTGPMAAARAAK